MIWYNINDMLYKDWMKMYDSKIAPGAEGLEMFGHTKDYHCGLSDDQMLDRIKYDGNTAASSFYSKEEMDKCIITALVEHKQEIAEWLMTKPKYEDFAIYQKNISDKPVGHGFNTDFEEIATKDAVVVLSTHGNDILTEFGFIVKTAYADIVSKDTLESDRAWKTGVKYEKEQIQENILDKLYHATVGFPKIKVDRYEDTIKYTMTPKSFNGKPLYMFCDRDEEGNISFNFKTKDNEHMRRLNGHEKMVANSECKMSIEQINSMVEKITSGEFISTLESMKYKDEVMDIYEIDSRSGYLMECMEAMSDQELVLVHAKIGDDPNGTLYIQSRSDDTAALMEKIGYSVSPSGNEKDRTYTMKEVAGMSMAAIRTESSYTALAKEIKSAVAGYTDVHYRQVEGGFINFDSGESWVHSDKYVNAFMLNKKSENFNQCIGNKGMESAVSIVCRNNKNHTIELTMNKNIGYAGTDIKTFMEEYMQIEKYSIKTSGLNQIAVFNSNRDLHTLVNDISCAVCNAEADEPDRELLSENEYVRVFDASCNKNIWHGFYSDEYGDTKAMVSLMHEPCGKQFIRVQINEEGWGRDISAAALVEKFNSNQPWKRSDSYPEQYQPNGTLPDFCYDTGIIEGNAQEYMLKFAEYVYNAIETAEQLKEDVQNIKEEDLAVQREDLSALGIPENLHDEIMTSMAYWVASQKENDFDTLFDAVIERFNNKIDNIPMDEAFYGYDNYEIQEAENNNMILEEECL